MLVLTILLLVIAVPCYLIYKRYQSYTSAREKRIEEEARMEARGFVKYKGKWGTPKQVFEWQQLDKGLVKYQGKWITPEEKARIEKFEIEQRRKGLIKFTDRFGQEHWGTPQEIEILRKKDFEEQQKAKGLVKYHGEWMTPEERFEKEQLAKGLTKYIDRSGRKKWGTPKEVKKWQQEDFEEEQRAKGLVKYMGRWISKDQAELLKFQKEKTPETLAVEIAKYIRESSIGISLNLRTINKLTLRFWLQRYRSVFSKRYWETSIASKMREAEGMALSKYLESLTEELMQWAQNRNLMRLTKADVKLFLLSSNIRLSTSLEQMLYREAKLKYRYLPPWMRK